MTVEQQPLLELKVNEEYYKLVPRVTPDVFNSLKNSIQVEGQHEEITVNTKGEILDGYTRWEAIKQLGIKPKFKVKEFPGELHEKLYVIDTNLQRRQLTDPQRVELSLKKKPILQELAKLNEFKGGKGVQICTPLGRVNEVIAKDAGVSARQVSKIETVLKKGAEDIKNNMLKGKITVHKAFNTIRRNELRAKLIEEASTSSIQLPKGIRLIHGSFIEKSNEIDENSIDLIFTDPPYDRESLPLYSDVATLAQRVLKPGGSLVVYSGQYFLDEVMIRLSQSGLKYWWEIAIVFPPGHEPIYKRRVFHEWKPLLWYIKGDRPIDGLPFMPDSVMSPHPNKDQHDWKQSPVEARHVIERLTVKNQVVLDPMLGTGTTGIEAIRLGRQFIGIERNEDTFNIAKGNIERESKV